MTPPGPGDGLARGMVTATGGGGYDVLILEGPHRGEAVHASLRGRLKREFRTGDRVVIGDRVFVARVQSGDGSDWVVEQVSPRQTQIVREGPTDRRPKVIAANVDRMLAVVAARDPEPRMEQLDRLLIIAESNGIPPVVVVNKVDLPDTLAVAEEIRSIYEPLGYPVTVASAESGVGLEELRGILREGSVALVGPSGVGKSSLLNALDPALNLRTGELSRKVRRGRHTTVRARMIQLPGGGMVADTPGFGDVGVWGVDPAEVEAHFPEIRQRSDECRFRGCRHVSEPGCAVRQAVEDGVVRATRYQSYLHLVE